MINYIIAFFILAVLSAFMGFGGLAADFTNITKLLAMVFVVLFLASLAYQIFTGKRANPIP